MKVTSEINEILELGHKLSTERYFNKLFEHVLEGSMKFTCADAGALYIVDGLQLHCLNFVNKTLDANGVLYEPAEEVMDIKPRNITVYSAIHKQTASYEDIYLEKDFDILKYKEFDTLYGYRTKSFMTVPILEPGQHVIGVMQLINCTDEGQVVPFPEEYKKVAESLTSQMAIALTNMNQIQELDDLIHSFVASMTTAIDARTPYNANHTVNVANYCMELLDYMNALHTRGEFRKFFSDNDKAQLYMAAMLHDLGKMITPREILNKSSRLGNKYDNLFNRLEKIKLMAKIDCLEGRLDSAEWALIDMRLDNFLHDLPTLNIKDGLTPDELERINNMATYTYVGPDGKSIPYLNPDEVKSLSIARGTLTLEERDIVQQHVVFTDKMLDKIKFNEKYNRVQKIASCHHEYLDGSGYPGHLRAEDLDDLTRLLTIVDIYDSLTSNDRPYKGTVPVPKALGILQSMASEGKLDKELVDTVCRYVNEHYVAEE